jgi:chromosome segregation ATPase
MLTSTSLTGRTRDQLGQVAAEAEELWPLLLAVGQRLDKARNVASSEAGSKQSRARNLAQLLDAPMTISGVALTDQAMTLTSAVARIRQRYSTARDGASEIESLWLDVLPRIDAARATLAALARDAENLGVVEPLISRALNLADDLSERLVNDPLSVHTSDGSNLDEQVSKAVRQISMLQTGRDDLAQDLVEARQLLASLRTLKSRAAASYVESQTKVLKPNGLIHTPSDSIFDDQSKGLAKQLDRVISVDGKWSAQRTLLDNWFDSARRLETQLSAAESANSRPLAERESLRGRLRAYQAKMAAVGKAEDMELTGVVDEARDELFTVPTDLLRAARIIADLAEQLRQSN